MLSHVQLFVTPWTVACQAPLPLEFSEARILEWVVISYSSVSISPVIIFISKYILPNFSKTSSFLFDYHFHINVSIPFFLIYLCL